eukprot:gene28435-31577_t
MSAGTAWSLTPEQRESTINRVTANISAMGLARNITIGADVARVSAVQIERKAYTAAEVASNTTTGHRPASETIETYARKLGEQLIEVVRNGGMAQAQSTTTAADGSVESIELDCLELTGSREFLTKESATDALKAMLAPGSKVKQIRFSTQSFGRDAANVAADAIKNVSATLTDADISDVIAGRPEDEALDALRILSKALSSCSLRNLNLSDNALGEKGIRACADAITGQAALEGISLQNIGCSIYACKAVEELLQASQALRSIQLFNNMSDNEGAEHIARILARAPLMEDLRFASSRVGPRGGAALAQGLMAGRCLLKLDISDNPITVDAAPALAQLINSQPKLRVLNLNDTSLTDRGVATICAGLTGAAMDLEELGLALNEITPKGVAMELWELGLALNEITQGLGYMEWGGGMRRDGGPLQVSRQK